MVFDIEKAFLCGKVEGEIFMQVSEGCHKCGFEITEDKVLELLMIICSLL